MIVLGTGAGSGKTSIATALLRMARLNRRAAAPFKAVTMISARDDAPSEMDVPRRPMHRLLLGAGLTYESIFNPVTVEPLSSGEHTLRIFGTHVERVELLADDTVDFRAVSAGTLTACKDAIGTALSAVAARHEFVVIEGAGAVGALPVDYDVANQWTALLTDTPVLVTCRWTGPGQLAGLEAMPRILSRVLRPRMAGFFLNDPSGDMPGTEGARFGELIGLPYLGPLPPVPPRGGGREEETRAIQRIWTRNVADALGSHAPDLLKALGWGSAGEVEYDAD